MEVTLMLISFESKYYQNEIWWNTSMLFNRHCQCVFGSMPETGTSPRPFYDFIKMTILRDLAIFNTWHLLFLNVSYSLFQKNETLESWYNLLLSYWSRLLNWKGPGTQPQFSEMLKQFPEIYCPCLYLSFGQVWWLNELLFKKCIQKCTVSCANSHHDTSDLVNHICWNMLRTEHNFSTKWKKSLTCASCDTFWEVIVL